MVAVQVASWLAIAFFAAGCRNTSDTPRGDPPAARVLDAQARRGLGLWEGANRREHVEARRLLTSACEGGSQLGCGGLGAMNLATNREPREAIALLTSACNARINPACATLAGAYDNGTGVARDDRKAAELAQTPCEAGEPVACAIYARAMLFGDHGVRRDPERARALAMNACELHVASSCTLVGLAESGVFANALEAQRWLLRGCDAGDGAGCAAVAYQYFDGGLAGEAKGVPVDPEQAVQYATRACDLESPIGCALLARALDRGVGVARDVVRAEQLATKACAANEPAGCAIAAAIAKHDRDPEHAERR